MLMILARLVRSGSFWAVAKVRSPHTGPGIRYIIRRSSGRPGGHCSAPSESARPRVPLPPAPPLHTLPVCRERYALCMADGI